MYLMFLGPPIIPILPSLAILARTRSAVDPDCVGKRPHGSLLDIGMTVLSMKHSRSHDLTCFPISDAGYASVSL